MSEVKTKVILHVKVADYLIKKGNTLLSVKPSKKLKGRVAFIFLLSEKLTADLKNYDPAKNL